jgi:hypothetical protein
MKEIWTNILQTLGLAWWVEVRTEVPRCTYYFGPFVSFGEAASTKGGYIEDLEQEAAQGIQVVIKRCKPQKLTVDYEMLQSDSQGVSSPVFSSQG